MERWNGWNAAGGTKRRVDAGAAVSTRATCEAFARTSRFGSVGVVLDLRDPDSAGVLAIIASADARRVVDLARKTSARFVVLAGQVHRKRAGAFGAAVHDSAALPMAALAAFHRLTECGESTSAWFVIGSDDMRDTVLAALAGATATAGTA
jgi:hypothetical protein